MENFALWTIFVVALLSFLEQGTLYLVDQQDNWLAVVAILIILTLSSYFCLTLLAAILLTIVTIGLLAIVSLEEWCRTHKDNSDEKEEDAKEETAL